jgi:8-oxo-dGTP pyrophosphatase MutT (NUDIX family)
VVPAIRAKVVGVFRQGNRILVGDSSDIVKQQLFYCPPGGGVEFGERSDAALRREIREELGCEIRHPRLLGVLENLFTLDGDPGHEIVFVYEAELENQALYETERFVATESNGVPFNMLWIDLGAIGPGTPPVYPDGLTAMLGRAP